MDGPATRHDAKFSHDQDRAFRARIRAVRALGQWAAGRLGLAGAEAESYARSLVETDFELPGDDDVIARLMADLPAGSVGAEEIRLKLLSLIAEEEAGS
ncbi:DUF1476 domain-containing protein [Magnetospirillum sp. UT-4]|uniref:DUF1476 domain-containing protein n=1 Tax=Magnetospirillum sp. UT-4 TaxID=2681467 RepID=UPI0013857E05|nr:DUF1476 domain-containing protein [Magnetospirillum sp. UT-4]CAA7621227.1 conserved hypothetical protein [Magnetospirillum sp. UT-4]